jgi:cytochrome c553
MRPARAAILLYAACAGSVLAGCAPAAPPTDEGGPASASPTTFGFGTPAPAALIAAWDHDVGPDGAGLPPGSTPVIDGLAVFAAKCAACHGQRGEGATNDRLAGRIPDDSFPFATDPQARYTVGSYWPYATTLYDYVRKAMPFDAPGSLTTAEVYGAVGAVLYFNDLLAEDAVVDSATIANLRMPSRDRFVRDDRTGGPVVR